MHTQLTHTGLYVDVIAKELALSERLDVIGLVCSVLFVQLAFYLDAN